jgi:hypothetical protein
MAQPMRPFRLPILLTLLTLIGLIIVQNRPLNDLELWSPWAEGTSIYVLYKHTGNDGIFSHKVGYIQVLNEPHRMTQRLLIEMKSKQGHLRLQQELQINFLPTLNKKVFINKGLSYQHKGYHFRWRELTQEQSGFWGATETQLSFGDGLVTKSNQPQSSQWCRHWSKAKSIVPTQQTEISFVALASKNGVSHASVSSLAEGNCSSDYPLPQSMWIWLVEYDQNDASSELSNHRSSFLLFNERTGLAQTIVEHQSSQKNSQSWLSNESPSSRFTLHFDHDLSRYDESSHEQLIWRGERILWSQSLLGSTHDHAMTQTMNELQYVKIPGTKLPWHRIKWVELDLNTPLSPLATHYQHIDVNPSHSEHRYHVILKGRSNQAQIAKQMKITLSPSTLPLGSQLSISAQDLQTRLKITHPTPINVAKLLQVSLAWMQEHIEYQVHRSTPDINHTLKRGLGDCNEQSLVFVELLKAFGVKAEMVFGLVYIENNRWGFHAWARVLVDDVWFYVDPSRGRLIDHPGYMPFATGDLSQQASLGRLVGQVHGLVISWSQ